MRLILGRIAHAALVSICVLTALCSLASCERDYAVAVFEEGGGITPSRDGEFSLRLDGVLEPFARGEGASLSVTGKPETAYTLRVFLSSGESSASGLGETLSDAEGAASWNWNISAATKPGTYKAYISGGGDYLTLDIEITE